MTGIISLTVFSFTMVMIVLNQTASQMSNRILDNLIGGRFQQIVLGLYIGTIVYALFLLSNIRDVDSGIHIPAFSTYFLILLTIIDLIVFIYFLHHITQSVKYEVIIRTTHDQTRVSMEKYCSLQKAPSDQPPSQNGYPSTASRCFLMIVGKQPYAEYCSTVFEFLKTLKDKEISFIPSEFIVSGDWAFQIGTYAIKYIIQDDNVVDYTGNYVWIFKKENDGTWKWARVISNSNKPA